jgi:hypothetical protein
VKVRFNIRTFFCLIIYIIKRNLINFRYDLGTIALNKAGKLRKYHQFIGIFSTKKGTFDRKSTNQPKLPE